MYAFKLRELRDKAKRLGPAGLLVVVVESLTLKLFEDRLVSWANAKLNEKAAPLLNRLVPTVVKFLAEHPFRTGVYIFAAFSAVLIAWAFISSNKDSERRPPDNERWPDLALVTGKASDGLAVWLENHTGKTIAECGLYLAGLHRFSEKTRSFVPPGLFSGVWLIKPQHLIISRINVVNLVIWCNFLTSKANS